MVGYNQYDSLDDFDNRRRKAIESMLLTDETFVTGIDTAGPRIFSSWLTKLILTDQRILAVQKALIGKETEDYGLDDISSIKFDTSWIHGKLTLQGSGINDEYKVPKTKGQHFVTSAREQIAAQ